ncbi:MAG: hypothetical protein WD532_02520 [Acidimicrobiia bacterium]
MSTVRLAPSGWRRSEHDRRQIVAPLPEVMLRVSNKCRQMHPGMLDFEGYLKASGFRLGTAVTG